MSVFFYFSDLVLVKIFTKGADSIVIPLLKNDTDPKLIEILMKHLKKYASEGLRF
jgi:magnesium-transporting ATPase (P-type)